MSDHRALLLGSATNVAGLAVGVLAAYAVQVALGRSLGATGLGLVTVAVQAAFVASAGSRFGMDLATVRVVAIGGGQSATATLRSLVDRCAVAAGVASLVVAAAMVAFAPLTDGERQVQAAAVSVPLIAVATTYLGATRGLRQMAPLLWVYWIGQPLAWLAAAVAALALGGEETAAVVTYDLSWLAAAVAAYVLWRRASRGLGDQPAGREEFREALRFGLPRAPGALFAQALFWIDLWVLSAYASSHEVGVYSAATRIGQLILLFLTAVNLLIAPYAADLHRREQREELNRMFVQATRWALAATLPVAITLLVAPSDALSAFGPGFTEGDTALQILVAGQLANVATGSVGVLLVMAGRTGLDLLDNALGAGLLAALAAALSSGHGMEGAAVASAVSLTAVNLVRLWQVRAAMHVVLRPSALAGLALPALAGALAALGAHAVAADARWWVALAATGAACVAAYTLVMPLALSPGERAQLRSVTRRITNRESR